MSCPLRGKQISARRTVFPTTASHRASIEALACSVGHFLAAPACFDTATPDTHLETHMSRGPGRVERAILAAFAAEPDNAFTTDDLCQRAFPTVNRVEKKHRVAVFRAAKKRPEVGYLIPLDRLGGQYVFFDPYNVISYAMARLKAGGADVAAQCRNNDPREIEHRRMSEADLRAMLAEGGKAHGEILPGGIAWKHVHWWTALRDGDEKKIAQFKAERMAKIALIARGSHPGIIGRSKQLKQKSRGI